MPSRRHLTQIVHALSKEYVRIEKSKNCGVNLGDNLCGMCAIASSALFQSFLINDQLFNSKFKPELVFARGSAWSHCWVESGGKIYDPTFKQFSPYIKSIHIGDYTDKHKGYTKLSKIRNMGDFFTWDEPQVPTQSKVDWFLERIFTTQELRVSNKVQTKIFSNKSKYFKFGNQLKKTVLDELCWEIDTWTISSKLIKEQQCYTT